MHVLLFSEMACVGRNLIRNSSSTAKYCCLFVQRRYRYKKKWAVHLRSKTPTELALEHFDAFYKPLFGQQWPSVRVALLSLPKYGAIINSASESESCMMHLKELGAIDLIQEAVNRVLKTKTQQKQLTSVEGLRGAVAETVDDSVGQTDTDMEVHPGEELKKVSEIQSSQKMSTLEQRLSEKEHEEASQAFSKSAAQMDVLEEADNNGNFGDVDDMKNLLMPDAMQSSRDLEYFMPTEQVFSEKEKLLREEYSQSMYQERAVSVPVLPGQFPLLPKSLNVMVFPSGNVSDFPKPSADKSHLLNYYLLDASSILPVLALDVRPSDYVLDLCAAPGGKTLALLQVLLSQGGHLDSNDVSQSRVKRLKTVLRSYLPGDLQEEFVTVTEQNGLHFRHPIYNKVLVDVPCNSDRHVVVEEDNNLFKPGRLKERLKMTAKQKELLVAGIKSCKPGGTVVYSTCTLAAVQNDGVVQAALEELWETSDMEVVVEDLSPLKTLLAPFFRFHSGTRLGLLVLPFLLNNYGPAYCCKLRRLS